MLSRGDAVRKPRLVGRIAIIEDMERLSGLRGGRLAGKIRPETPLRNLECITAVQNGASGLCKLVGAARRINFGSFQPTYLRQCVVCRQSTAVSLSLETSVPI
jgi:hypothetical protein